MLYRSSYKIVSLDTIALLDTHVGIKNPYWQWSGIIMILCKHYIYLRYTNTLLDVLFILLAVILSELHENTRRKDWITEKKLCIEEFVCGTSLFYLHVLLLKSFFVALLIYFPPLLSTLILRRKNIAPENGGGGVGAGAPCPPVSTTWVAIFYSLITSDSNR